VTPPDPPTTDPVSHRSANSARRSGSVSQGWGQWL